MFGTVLSVIIAALGAIGSVFSIASHLNRHSFMHQYSPTRRVLFTASLCLVSIIAGWVAIDQISARIPDHGPVMSGPQPRNPPITPDSTTRRSITASVSKPALSQSPDATENNAWRVALANRKDCDAIRRYILQYPDGHFVAPAQAILAARRPVTEVRWGAFEFPANVVASSSLEARTSRDAACNSAHAQLLRNMADGCSDFTRDSAKYRSVIVDAPSNTTCQCDDSAIHIGTADGDAVWRCSIRATYRCRGEQSERVTTFTCN
jgi:hypothetical protein